MAKCEKEFKGLKIKVEETGETDSTYRIHISPSALVAPKGQYSQNQAREFAQNYAQRLQLAMKLPESAQVELQPYERIAGHSAYDLKVTLLDGLDSYEKKWKRLDGIIVDAFTKAHDIVAKDMEWQSPADYPVAAGTSLARS